MPFSLPNYRVLILYQHIIAKAAAPRERTEIAMKYLFLDLETPNSRNDRISQIAVILSEDKNILAEYNWLVNPEVTFERFNINLTGLDPQECYAAPIFSEIWAKLLPLIVEADAIVGHNVTFDLGVINKCLEYYAIPAQPVRYICTLKAARATLNCPKYGLEPLCDYLNIEFNNHHNALADVRATLELYFRLLAINPAVKSYCCYFELPCQDFIDSHKPALKEGEQQAALIKLISGKKVAVTGEFAGINRGHLERLIEIHGRLSKTVNKSTEILLVGGAGSKRYKSGTSGRKLESAEALIAEGKDIKIIGEMELLAYVARERRLS